MAEAIRIPIDIISRDALKQVEKFAKSAQNTLNKTFSNGAKSVTKLNSALAETVNEYEKLNDENQKFQENAKAVATRATVAFAGFSAAIAGAVSAASSFEDISVQFEVLTGSAESAAKAVEQLSRFTAATPFRFEEVAQAGKQLLGFGFQVEQIEERLQSIGDVAAASGTNINEISLIFGQVSAAGKLTGERLLQFQERAIPIGPALAKTLGVAESAVKDLVSRGVVDFATFQKAFDSLSETGGFAFGGLQKQSKTLSGILSTLGDNFNLLVADIGKRFLPTLKEAANTVIGFIQTLRQNPAIAEFAATLLAVGAAVSGLIASLTVGALAFNQLNIAFKALRAGFLVLQGSILSTLSALAPFVAVIGAVIAAGVALVKALSFINDETGALSVIFEVVTEVASDLFNSLSPIGDLFQFIADAAAKAARVVGGLFVTALTKVLSLAIDLVKANPFGIFSEDQVKRVTDAQKRLNGLSDSIQEVGFDLGDLKDETDRTTASIEKASDSDPYKGLSESAKTATTSVEKSLTEAKGASDRFIQDFQKQTASLNEQIQKSISAPSFGDSVINLFGGPSEQTRQIANLQKQLDANIKLTPLERSKQQKDIDDLKESLNNISLVNIGTSLAGSFARGKAGAKDLTKNLSKIGINAIAPGFGEAAGPLIDLFAQGPEATKAAVAEFANEVPVIVENLVAAAPAFVEAIADKAPDIIQRLADRADIIIISLVRAIPKVAVALASALAFEVPLALVKSAPEIAVAIAKELAITVPGAIAQGILDGISTVGNVFFEVGKKIFDGFLSVLKGGFDIIGDIFESIFGFVGGGRGPVEKFLGFDFPFIAFNSGGVIPGKAPFRGDDIRNDLVPTLLSPGEIVIPRSAVNAGQSGISGFLAGLGIPVQPMFIGGIAKSLGDVISDVKGGITGFVSNPVDFTKSFARNPTQITSSVINGAFTIPGGDALLDSLSIFDDEIPLVGDFLGPLIQKVEQAKLLLEALAKIGASVDLIELITNPFGAVENAVKSVIGVFKAPLAETLRANSPFPGNNAFGLQTGGQIPSGFPNDTFPAGLTSGELVVDRGLTSRLEASISRDEQGASGNDVTNALLVQILDALQTPTEVNTSVNIEGRRLADAVLQLSRTNQRLA